MALVMISIGKPSRSGVRTLPGRIIAAVALIVAALLLALGATLGFVLAPAAAPGPTALAADTREAAEPHAYTIEQLGALSARLFKLESEATALAKRLGVLPADTAASAPRKRRQSAAPGTGGPMLEARAPQIPAPLAALSERLAEIEDQLAAIGDQSALHQLKLMTLPTRLPVLGAEIGSHFGNRIDPITRRVAFHAGLDLAAETGTPILASAGGRVVFAGWRPDYGNTVEVAHGDGLVTRYAHASRLFVKTGEIVVPGERIALVGSTGRSTGPHLHFEVMRRGEHVDPRRYLAGL